MEIPSPRTRKRARIEIIPLIDVVFFLLATFMMVSLSMVRNNGIAVHLPVASAGAAQDRKDFVSLTVTARGEIFWDKEKTSLAELPARLAKLKAAAADPKIFLNGDTKAELGSAVAVLDEVRKAGIAKIAIETKPAP
jgi:biopolymer transport protein ExbD